MQNICVVLLSYLVIVHCSAYDDGKYHPKKYNLHDDGMYYRPLDEGKYIPGDEGRYTYIYVQGLYPDYPYVHQVGPNGGFGPNGRNGGNGGYGGKGGYGGEGGYGSEGSGEDEFNKGPDGSERPDKIEYIGRKIYAARFPYMHSLIKELIEKYVSIDTLFGEESDGSVNHYMKVFGNRETAVKCHYLNSKSDDEKDGFTTQYPPRPASDNGKHSGSYYSFKGTKILDNHINSANMKTTLKLEYEVFVRIVDEVTKQ